MAQDTQVTELHSVVQLETLEIAGGKGRDRVLNSQRIILLSVAFAMAIELNVLAAVGEYVLFLIHSESVFTGLRG